MRRSHVLLVEDEPRLAGNLRKGLLEEGFEVRWVDSAESAEDTLRAEDFDLIVLDLRLPGKDGLEFLREQRAAGNQTPVLILTARGSVDERVSGLDSGADDYLAKPFAFTELVARIRALARRRRPDAKPVLTVGEIRFDTLKRRAWRAGQPLSLSPKEAMLLELFMRHAGEVLSRDAIAHSVWDSSYQGLTNLIEVFVNRIRQKIDQEGQPSMIATVRGVGYSMRAEPGE